MNILGRIIKEYLEEKILSEGFREDLDPDSKYYAFDWDDNIVYMPTKIIITMYIFMKCSCFSAIIFNAKCTLFYKWLFIDDNITRFI